MSSFSISLFKTQPDMNFDLGILLSFLLILMEYSHLGDSTEVGPLEILRVSFLLGNGQAPSDIPSDTKNSIRVVH